MRFRCTQPLAMGELYYRIYYTIYRILIHLSNDDSDDPKFAATLILSFFVMLNALTILFLLIAIIKISFIVNNKLHSVIFLIAILTLNFYLRKKLSYLEVSHSESWSKIGSKSFLITIGYFILTVALFVCLLFYIKPNPITK